MSILESEIYKKYKVESTIALIAVPLIGFVWTYGDNLWPFPTTIKLTLLWLSQIIATGIIIIVALGTYIVYLLIKLKRIHKNLTFKVVIPDKNSS